MNRSIAILFTKHSKPLRGENRANIFSKNPRVKVLDNRYLNFIYNPKLKKTNKTICKGIYLSNSKYRGDKYTNLVCITDSNTAPTLAQKKEDLIK